MNNENLNMNPNDNLKQSNIVKNSMNMENLDMNPKDNLKKSNMIQNSMNLENINMNQNLNALNQNKIIISYNPQNPPQYFYDMPNVHYEANNNYNNINRSQSNTIFHRPLISQSVKKALIQENTLPSKYLPEKVNKVIVDNNIKTLPLIMSNLNNPTTISYQGPDNRNQQFQYEF